MILVLAVLSQLFCRLAFRQRELCMYRKAKSWQRNKKVVYLRRLAATLLLGRFRRGRCNIMLFSACRIKLIQVSKVYA